MESKSFVASKVKGYLEKESLDISSDVKKAGFKRLYSGLGCYGNPASTLEAIKALFDYAGDKMKDEDDKALLDDLRKTLFLTQFELLRPKPRYLDAMFFPNDKNVDRLCGYLRKAKRTLSICVFNFTNNDLSGTVRDLHFAGVKVRIITDDECVKNKGSDVDYLRSKGIPVVTDTEVRYHMHNKFVVVDKDILITGSFNWTVQAALNNQENLIVTSDSYLISRYTQEFDRLWKEFSGNTSLRPVSEDEAASKIQKAYKKHYYHKKY